MRPEMSVALTFTGAGFDPDGVTATLGLEPTETWRFGDRILNTRLKREHDGWSLSTGRKKEIELENQVRSILEKVQSRLNKVKSVSDEHDLDVELACVVYVADETPSMHLDSEVVELMAELGAEIDIDLYVLPPEKSHSKMEKAKEPAVKQS